MLSSSKLLLIAALFYGGLACASTGRMITLQGKLIRYDSTNAILQDGKGTMRVPASTVDKSHVDIGQWITASVDFVDFYRLNPEKFKDSHK